MTTVRRLAFSVSVVLLFLGSSSPPPVDCACLGLEDCIVWGCPGTVDEFCSVTLLEDGLCNEAPGCVESTPKICRWEVHLRLGFDPASETTIQLFMFGQEFARSKNSMEYGPRQMGFACGSGGTIALGTDDAPCVEAFMECEPCDPN